MTRVFDVFTRAANLVETGLAIRAAVLILACAVLASTLCGCAGGAAGKSAAATAVESIHVLSVPVAVDFDGVPGPDGFAVTVFAKGLKSAKGVPLPDGKLELLMYDGLFLEGKPSGAEPLRVWRFSRSELKLHSGKSAVGTGYRFTLRWEEARPTKSRISIVVRYLPVSGPPVVSAPSSVAIGTK